MTQPALSVPPAPSRDSDLRRDLARLCPELRARALRLAKDPAAADDLVQDTVERALRFASQYRPGTSVRAWAHQILFSVFVTRYRRGRREVRALRELATNLDAWPHTAPFRSPEHGDLSPATAAHLSALPDGYRDVIVRVDLGDSTYREAAAELGVPLGTVMSRLHRGRRMLAASLGAAAA